MADTSADGVSEPFRANNPRHIGSLASDVRTLVAPTDELTALLVVEE